MPQAAKEMIQQLGLALRSVKTFLDECLHWDEPLAGNLIKKGASLFPRIESKSQGVKP